MNNILSKDFDIDDISQVRLASWKHAFRGIVPDVRLDSMTLDEFRKRMLTELNESRCEVIVSKIDAITNGYVIYGQSRDDDCDSLLVGEIMQIYIHPDYTRKSIGRVLLDKALQELYSQKFGDVRVWCFEDNMPARQFYEKNGFELDGAVKYVTIGGKSLKDVRYRRTLEGHVHHCKCGRVVIRET